MRHEQKDMNKAAIIGVFFVGLVVWWMWSSGMLPRTASPQDGAGEPVATSPVSEEPVQGPGDGGDGTAGQREFGFIRGIDLSGERAALLFDDAIWHSGEAAKDAAVRSGACAPEDREECTPNDFFIENTDESIERVPVAGEVTVVMITHREVIDGPLTESEISFAEFVTLITDETLHWNTLPYHITRNTVGEVVKIEEVYVP
jgi:hypothetical protein